MAYDHQSIEPKWQNFWAEHKTFQAKNDSDKPKYYALDMFPYPSGAGLHVGHPLGYTATDIICRKKRHQGYNVLHPMGWDAFGLPAENYAIKTGVHPATSTNQNIDNFRRQIQSLGFSYDWEREFSTTDPDYYRWSQWIFLELYKKGLAYEKEMPMNWCPSCKIVAANEEVEDGHHERCGSPVEKKNLKQWMFRITDYAERLLNDLDTATVHIVHGWEGVGNNGWFNPIKDFCAQAGINFSALDYPNTSEPDYPEWKSHFQKHSKLWPQDVVIAHSLGNNFMFRYLVEENKTLDQLVLIAPVKMTDMELLNTFFDQEFDWAKIKNLVNKITIIYSDDDEYITVPDFEFIADQLNAKKIFLKNRGHFSPSKNPELPELMPILESLAKDTLDWPDKIKAMQRNWIGKSEGMLFTAPVKDTDLTIQTFSAHFEAFCADTFVVIAPDHPFLETLLDGVENKQEILAECKELIRKRMERGFEEEKEPEGIFTGRYIVDPVGNGDLPIWVASFALADYGTGIVKCSVHDERDFAFAKKYGLMLKPVLVPPDPEEAEKVKNLEYCYTDMAEGTLMEPAEFKGQFGPELREQIKNYLVTKGLAERQVSYKLRDWIFTRQRYWGEPIPLVFDADGNCYPLDDSELPLTLPDTPNYEPSETGESPLAKIDDWVNVKGYITETGTVKIPHPGPLPVGEGELIEFRRETSTMPNWAGSSWYWLRFMDPHNEQEICSKASEDYWGPVDLYVGGAEHAVLHLLYGRFWHKVLYDLGHVTTREPFKKLVNQGLIMAEDGTKMSKSIGNVINPDDVVDQYGADTLRCYEMFMGPFEQNKAWSMGSVGGTRKWLDRVDRVFQKLDPAATTEQKTMSVLHQTIKQVGSDIDNFKFNTAISQLMVLTNELTSLEAVSKEVLETLAVLISPFAPHLAEEAWRETLGHTDTIVFADWPTFDEKYLVQDSITYGVQVNGKVRGQLEISAEADKDTALTAAKDLENVAKWLSEGTIRKEIFVPGKIIGFVVN